MIANERKILSIQALRGIAAILVVFCHSEQFISEFSTVHLKIYLGQCFGQFGVDIFFVISGFIMVYISHNNFGDRRVILPFLMRRFTRIFPIYWLMTLIVVLLIIPSGLYSYALPESQLAVVDAIKSTSYLFKSFLLIPINDTSFNPPVVGPVIGVAWTLVYEMFFYYVFSLVLLCNRKYYLPVLIGIFSVWAISS